MSTLVFWKYHPTNISESRVNQKSGMKFTLPMNICFIFWFISSGLVSSTNVKHLLNSFTHICYWTFPPSDPKPRKSRVTSRSYQCKTLYIVYEHESLPISLWDRFRLKLHHKLIAYQSDLNRELHNNKHVFFYFSTMKFLNR